jgi:hypothetical protein
MYKKQAASRFNSQAAPDAVRCLPGVMEAIVFPETAGCH